MITEREFYSQDKKGQERLERFQHNHDELKKIADKMWPYFEEIFILDFSLDFFNKEYHLHETEMTAHTVT